MDDIELYEFFKDFSCEYFQLDYDHKAHCWDIYYGHRHAKVSREDLVKLESQLKEFKLKYLPKQEPLGYEPD